MTGSVMWNLGSLGEREGRLTWDAIEAMELVHGPIGGTIARFTQEGAGAREVVSLIHATLIGAEGDGAPTREQIQAAVFEVGLGEFMAPANEVLRMILSGVRPAEERLQ